MNQTALLDASWLMPAWLGTGLARSLCTIQAHDGVIASTGVASGTYADVAGLVDIQCQDAPENFGSGIAAMEAKAPMQTTSMECRHVLLAGYYPQLAQQTNWGDIGWRAVITSDPTGTAYSTTYDIKGAESDSQSLMTRLKLAKVTV